MDARRRHGKIWSEQNFFLDESNNLEFTEIY